jgi:hypothetical protein
MIQQRCDGSDHDDKIKAELDKLLELKYGILTTRFLNPRTSIPKTSAFTELLWILPDQEFKQELRMSN